MSPTESVRNYSTPPLRTRGSLVKLTIFAQFVPKMTFLALALAPHTRPGLRKGSSASPIYVVDLFSALDVSTYLPNSNYTADGVHPSVVAAQLKADKMYSAIVAQGLF